MHNLLISRNCLNEIELNSEPMCAAACRLSNGANGNLHLRVTTIRPMHVGLVHGVHPPRMLKLQQALMQAASRKLVQMGLSSQCRNI